jgi:hypothetical protein
MQPPPDRKRVIRIAGLVVAIAGSLVMGASVVKFLLSVARNQIDGSRALTIYPEYYLRIGAYYSRGFATGFFLCYFLMLFAIIAGSWVDEHLKARRAARNAAPRAPVVEPIPVPGIEA